MWRSDFATTLNGLQAVIASNTPFYALSGIYQVGE